MEHNIKNPSGKLVMNGTSFNEFAVAAMTEPDFIAKSKKSLKNTHFFGNRNDQQRNDLLKEVYKIALHLTGKSKQNEDLNTEPNTGSSKNKNQAATK